MKRPMVWICLSYLYGIVVLLNGINPGVGLLGALLVLAAVSLYYKRAAYLFLTLAVLFATVQLWMYQKRYILPANALHGQTVTFEGRIVDIPSEKSETSATYKIRPDFVSVGEYRYLVHGMMQISAVPGLQLGETVKGTATVEAAGRIKPQNSFDYGNYLKGKGIYLTGYANTLEKTADANHTLIDHAVLLRQRITNTIRDHIPAPSKGLLIAMSTGDKSELNEKQKNVFSRTGTSHVMAVSGLHVSILTGFLIGLLQLLRLKRRPVSILCILVLLCIMPVMAFTPSVVRACIMGIILMLADCVLAEADPVNSLAIAAVVILVVQPYAILDVSFILSFAATLGILLFAKPMREFLKKRGVSDRAAGLLSVTLSAYLATCIIIAYYFNECSLISPLANLLAVPVFPVLLGGAFVLVLLNMVFPMGASVFAFLLHRLTLLFYRTLEVLAGLPFSAVTVPTPGVFTIAAYLAILLFLYCYANRIRVKAAFCILLSFAVLFSAFRLVDAQYLKITTIDAGRIDNLLIQPVDRNNLLIAGCIADKHASYAGSLKNLQSYFKKSGIKRIDILVLSNYNKDTISLLSDLEEYIKGGVVLGFDDDEGLEEARRTVTGCGAAFRLLDGTKGIRVGKDGVLQVTYDKKFTLYSSEMLVARILPPDEEDVHSPLVKNLFRRSLFVNTNGTVQEYPVLSNMTVYVRRGAVKRLKAGIAAW